jgi:hypothetical protein
MHSTPARIHIYAFNLLLKALDSEILFKKYKIYCTILASFKVFLCRTRQFFNKYYTVQYSTVQYIMLSDIYITPSFERSVQNYRLCNVVRYIKNWQPVH